MKLDIVENRRCDGEVGGAAAGAGRGEGEDEEEEEKGERKKETTAGD